MSRDKDADGVPDLLLERYVLGELPPAEAGPLAQRLRSDEGLRRRIAELARSDEEIRRRYPAAWLAERIRAHGATRSGPSPATRTPRSRHWPIPAALAVAATVLLVLAPRVAGPPPAIPGVAPPPTHEAGDRIKGLKPALALFRKTSAGSEALADGDLARAGDLIRVGYRAAGRTYGVIVSLDGRGAVTLHLPAQGRQSARLQTGDVVLLDQAYELDDAPQVERFFFVTAESPFDVAPVVEAARHAAAPGGPAEVLSLPRPLEQSALSLEKEARP